MEERLPCREILPENGKIFKNYKLQANENHDLIHI